MRELVSHCTTIDETEPQRTAALADAIISAVGAEHVDKFGEFTPPLSDRDPPPPFLPPLQLRLIPTHFDSGRRMHTGVVSLPWLRVAPYYL